MFHHYPMPSGHVPPSATPGRSKERTRRACERCRQMKIKCDGAPTCGHCQASFSDCMYLPPRRKRKASPDLDRLEELEKRLKAMEESMSAAKGSPQSSKSSTGGQHVDQPLDGPRQGVARFTFSPGDRAFIERLKTELGDQPGADFDSRLHIREKPGVQLFQSTRPGSQIVSLPPRERAEHLTNIALDASVLYQVVHRPTFDAAFELLYSLDRSDYGEAEAKHIPLVYALMALGCLFEEVSSASSERGGRAAERMRYFATCRDLVDLHDCNDVIALQAIFYMNLFILSHERLSHCYTCLSHAFSLAVRLNLGTHTVGDNLVVMETKKRLFWCLRQLLMVVASMCGLPQPFNGHELNIGEPLDLDDTDLKPTTILQPSQGHEMNRSMSGSTSYLRLQKILGRILQELYISHGAGRSGSTSHLVSTETVKKLEDELQRWATSLPLNYKLGSSRCAAHLEKAKYDLWMTYSHLMILLYRPFLHYFADITEQNGQPEQEFRKYASACVDASRDLIQLTEKMQRDNLLHMAHWKTAYMIFTAGLSLIYVVVGSKSPDAVKSLMTYLTTAKRVLLSLAPYSFHAHRLQVALTVLIATFTKSVSGSQSQSPNATVRSDSDKQAELASAVVTAHGQNASDLGNQQHTGPGVGATLGPSATTPAPGPENAHIQPIEPVMEAVHVVQPEISDQASFLEAQPFHQQRPTGADEYLFGGEFAEFGRMSGDLLNLDDLF
ncbi:hypothetical protein BJX76DRAFT_344343 [Aspergillus varians]